MHLMKGPCGSHGQKPAVPQEKRHQGVTVIKPWWDMRAERKFAEWDSVVQRVLSPSPGGGGSTAERQLGSRGGVNVDDKKDHPTPRAPLATLPLQGMVKTAGGNDWPRDTQRKTAAVACGRWAAKCVETSGLACGDQFACSKRWSMRGAVVGSAALLPGFE